MNLSLGRRRFRRRHGGIEVSLPEHEGEVLGSLLEQYRELLMIDEDPALVRLKPPARPDDEAAEAEYREMIGDQLLRGRLEAIETVEGSLAGAVLDDEGTQAWLQTVNGLRLVLGERLDVTDELPDLDATDPEAPAFALYEWLGWLLEQLVGTVSETLPDDPART